MNSDGFPKFTAPPVLETALCAQFSPLQGFPTALFGWFWKQYLTPEWVALNHAPKLPDYHEQFDEEVKRSMRVLVGGAGGNERVQIVRKDGERAIQVQDSKFILNWRRRTQGYPTYNILLPEFKNLFSQFEKFLGDANVPRLDMNQWEVTYVNQIPQGELWQSISDARNVFPGLYIPNVGNMQPENISGNWSFALDDQRGRLYSTIRLGKTKPKAPKTLVLQFTARGPAQNTLESLLEGLDIGHAAIVKTFAAITSEAAQRIWQRTA